MSNTTRIAKNTLALYFRQILIMLVSLYTVRVVLETLGTEDYGIYHLVAGIVTMFLFIRSSLASAGQRYFSFELGRKDYDQLKRVFSLTLLINMMIAAIILLLAETIGLWFVINKLIIPAERKLAALWVYQFAIVSFLSVMLAGPYTAMIIAHEDMKIYAYVSIVDALSKLAIVFVLRYIQWDKLTLYGFLLLITYIISTSIFIIISLKKYKQCRFLFYWNRDLFREIASYSGWIMFGVSADIFKKQIVNIMLNQFFSPVLIAARSIAVAVDNAAMSFSQNFNMAMRPQIIKSYAAGEKETMLTFLFRSSKGSYLLMFIVALPLLLEMPMVLGIWLKNPPEYSVLFTRLMLLDILVGSAFFPIATAVQATGRIKLFQSVVGIIMLLNAPVSWIILLMGVPPYSVLFVAIILTIIGCTAQLLMLKRLIDYSISRFAKSVLLPVCIVSIVSAIVPLMFFYFLKQGFARLCVVTGLSIISVCVSSYFIGLNKDERQTVKSMVYKFAMRKKDTQ